MTSEEKKKVAKELTEKTSWVWVGWLFIPVKPLTLGQIYEIGVYTCEMDARGLSINARIIASAEMFSRYQNAKPMQEIFLIAAFRRKWMRRLFRRYILNRLTVSILQKAIEVITNAYSANFFLTSIIFLHQTNQITEPSPTIVHGQQSEE